jgi:K+ transporter
MRGKKTIIGIAAAAAVLASGAAPSGAQAMECVATDLSDRTPPNATVCFTLGQSGGTFSPYVETTLCVGYICGTNEWVNTGPIRI